jgi:hypothetical protein
MDQGTTGPPLNHYPADSAIPGLAAAAVTSAVNALKMSAKLLAERELAERIRKRSLTLHEVAALAGARRSLFPRASAAARFASGLLSGGLPSRLIALGGLRRPARVLLGLSRPGLGLGRPGLRAADRLVPLQPRRSHLLLSSPPSLSRPCLRSLGHLLGSSLRHQRLGQLRISLPRGRARLPRISLSPLAAPPEHESRAAQILRPTHAAALPGQRLAPLPGVVAAHPILYFLSAAKAARDNRAARHENALMAAAGTPPGTGPECPADPDGY